MCSGTVIQVGEHYHYCGRDYQIMEVVEDRVQMRSLDGPPQVLYQSLTVLRRASDQGRFVKLQEAPIKIEPHKIIARLPKKQAEQLELRYAYVSTGIQECGMWVTRKSYVDFVTVMMTKLGTHKAPGYTTFWQWKRVYLSAGCNAIALMPNTFRPINKHISHQPREVREVIKQNIATFYWTPTPFSKTALIESIRLMLVRLNEQRAMNAQFRIPSKSTVYRIVGEINSHETTLHQRGAKAAKKTHYWGAPWPEPDRVLERVEGDSRPMDGFAKDQYQHRGRPVLTAMIDVKTRYIISWHISFNPASLDTTLTALQWSMCSDNPHGGIAELYIVDNGAEWIADILRKILYLLGGEISYCEPGEPNQKPHIEAFFKTWASQIEHAMKGTTFGSITAKGEYDAKGNAVYSLKEIESNFARWLETYHADEHSALSMSPNEAWAKAQSSQLPPQRYSTDDLHRYFWRSAEVTPHASGRVRHDNLLWWGPAVSFLANLVPKVKKLLLYYDAGDLGKAWICHPRFPDAIEELKPIQPAYQSGLSLDFHHEIQNQRKALRKAKPYQSAKDMRTILLWEIAAKNNLSQNSKTPKSLAADAKHPEDLLRRESPSFAGPTITNESHDVHVDAPKDFSVSGEDN